MTTHIVGRESSVLAEIKSGGKTIEARIAKARFKRFKPGDRIKIREDSWRDGKIVGSKMSDVETVIVKVEKYDSFDEMLENVELGKVNPDAKSKDEALMRIRSFYTPDLERKFGALAIHFKLVK